MAILVVYRFHLMAPKDRIHSDYDALDVKGIKMPKLKTHSGSKKRFMVTGSGKIKRKKANRRHILTKKSRKRKLHLADTMYVKSSDLKRISRCLAI